MMLSEDQAILKDTFGRYFSNEMPIAKIRALVDSGVNLDRGWWTATCELGACSLLAPPELGGGGISGHPLVDLGLVATEVGRSLAPGPFIMSNLVIDALTRSPNSARHKALVQALMSGESIVTWAHHEPRAPFDTCPKSVSVTAQGEQFLLSGIKNQVEYLCETDAFLVSAQGAGDVFQFLVSKDTPGLTIKPVECLDLNRSIGTVSFDRVELAGDSIVSRGPAAIEAIARQNLIVGALQCAEAIGCMERVFEFTLEWMFERYSFGRPIASYQALKHRMADMKLWLEASISVTEMALEAVDADAPEAPELVSVAKAYVGEYSTELIQEAVQFHGGIGVTWEHDLHLYLRRSAFNRVTQGTPSDHRRRVTDIVEAKIRA